MDYCVMDPSERAIFLQSHVDQLCRQSSGPYILAEAVTSTALTDIVNQLLARGYKPVGGVSVSLVAGTDNRYYAQAMMLA